MMIICNDCGEVFDETELSTYSETHGFNDGMYETFSRCPFCGSEDFEDAYKCEICGEYFPEEKLYDGICEGCLKEKITYDNFFNYLKEDEERLGNFIFEYVFDNVAPKSYSYKMIAFLEEVFLRIQKNDMLCGSEEFLDLCKDYVLNDDGVYGKIDYAEWLRERRVKSVNGKQNR